MLRVSSVPRDILSSFKENVYLHRRVNACTAMGVAATPLSCPVVIAAEFAIRPAK